MNYLHFRSLLTGSFLSGVAMTALLGATSVRAETLVVPGTTTEIDITASAGSCVTEEPVTGAIPATADCVANANASDGAPLRVLAASGLSSDPETFFGQNVLSVATLSSNIQIPVPSGGAYSSVLPVQIATEVAWSGGAIVAGIDSTFAQVAATFQIRDVTDATVSDPGPVVASDDLLFERIDADFDIIIPEDASAVADYLNLIEIVDITNSSGTDITAYLVRGRTYAIEIEAKCDVQVPVLGFGACLFSSDVLTLLNLPENALFPALNDDGFSATNISVTVASDPVQDLLDPQ
ncbi:MAG: hypothetical protein V2J55_03530 [Candidatus Competibacteraceae bacterium]|jgi:hypothetical protein|nr:hypothetical protein [Candidatus Competibacteraceae bacterium]